MAIGWNTLCYLVLRREPYRSCLAPRRVPCLFGDFFVYLFLTVHRTKPTAQSPEYTGPGSTVRLHDGKRCSQCGSEVYWPFCSPYVFTVSSLQAAIHNKLSPQLHLFLSFPIMWAMILRKKKRKDFYSLWEKKWILKEASMAYQIKEKNRKPEKVFSTQ